MGDGRPDLPEDSTPPVPCTEPSNIKDEVSALSEALRSMESFDQDVKELPGTENVIPLSPQWLHTRTAESKVPMLLVSGDPRTLNGSSHGGSSDLNLKDHWRGDASHEKKEWRRSTSGEIESVRRDRWREDERDSSAVARRDRRKEGERESDTRKGDRWSESVSIREVSESRRLPLTDRWQEANSRDTVHEARRDTKWSTRWGPEDKEKDARWEKRAEGDKEDGYHDRQTLLTNSRAATDRESEVSRDKWRPRHRLDVHSSGYMAHKIAPGFGVGRGRSDGSSVGFAVGRGRSNCAGSTLVHGFSVIGPIGASSLADKNEPVQCQLGLFADGFRYPRGKLLDIYRKCKFFPSVGGIPNGFVEVNELTHSEPLEPLAFIAPEPEEEAVLEDIWKGKITSSGAAHGAFRDVGGRVCHRAAGVKGLSSGSSNNSVFDDTVGDNSVGRPVEVGPPCLEVSECLGSAICKEKMVESQGRDADVVLNDGRDETLAQKLSSVLFVESTEEISKNSSSGESVRQEGSCSQLECKLGDGFGNHRNDPSIIEITSSENGEMDEAVHSEHCEVGGDIGSSISSEVSIKLPPDVGFLFDNKSFEETLGGDFEDQGLETKDGIKLGEQNSLPEELSLFYKDPQGDTQGPFLGIDIISWFEQGYFGTDLLVCPSDAPEGMPFQALGDVMPHLSLKSRAPSGFISTEQRGEIGGTSVISGQDKSSYHSVIHNQEQSSSNIDQDKSSSGFSGQAVVVGGLSIPDMPKGEGQNTLAYDGLPCLENSVIAYEQEKHVPNSLTHDDEEIVLAGTPGLVGAAVVKPTGSLEGTSSRNRMPVCSWLESENVATQSQATAFGALWSGLEGDRLELTCGPLDGAVTSSPTGVTTVLSRTPSQSNYQQWDTFSSSVGSSCVASSSFPIDRAWPEVFQRGVHSNHNLFQGAPDSRHLLHLEQNLHLEQAELVARQLQHQQQHQILPPTQPPLHTGGPLLDQLTNSVLAHNFSSTMLQQPPLPPSHQQQSCPQVSQSGIALDQLLRIQLQQQPHHQLQMQQHRQPRHQVQLQQQQQTCHSLLEQVLHGQTYDPSYGHAHIGNPRGNPIDQILFRPDSLRADSQPYQQPALRHSNSLEQLFQAKLDQNIALDHQACQFSVPSQQQKIVDERRISGVWAVDESGQFVRTQASTPLHPFDLYEQQRPFSQQQYLQQQSLNFPSSRSTGSNADIKAAYAYERAKRLERNILEGRSSHGMYDPKLLPFERIASAPVLSGVNMDPIHSLAVLQELRMQERYSGTPLPAQGGSFLSEINHIHSQALPMQLQGLKAEITNRGWGQSSNTSTSDVPVQGAGYFMQHGQSLDFAVGNPSQQLQLGGLNWQMEGVPQDQVSVEQWPKSVDSTFCFDSLNKLPWQSSLSTHDGKVQTGQLHGDSILQFSLHSSQAPVMPDNLPVTDGEQNSSMWTAVSSAESISVLIDDSFPTQSLSSDSVSNHLSKSSKRDEPLKLEDVRAVDPNVLSQTMCVATNMGPALQSKSLKGVSGTEASDGPITCVARNSAIETGSLQPGAGLVMEELSSSSNSNVLELPVSVPNLILPSPMVDNDFSESKEVKKNKRRNSKVRGTNKMDLVSSLDVSSVLSTAARAEGTCQSQLQPMMQQPFSEEFLLVNDQHSSTQSLPAWSIDLNKQVRSMQSVMEIQKAQQNLLEQDRYLRSQVDESLHLSVPSRHNSSGCSARSISTWPHFSVSSFQNSSKADQSTTENNTGGGRTGFFNDNDDFLDSSASKEMPKTERSDFSSVDAKRGHQLATTRVPDAREYMTENLPVAAFRKTSSFNDTGVRNEYETSFINMQKNYKKSEQEVDKSKDDAGAILESENQGPRSKRKSKKGRQIDPSLLGFKVTSNRIMMGEIQGLDD